jgi:hypothetical protein
MRYFRREITMKMLTAIAFLAITVLATGCASGLNSMQKREYAAFERDEVLVVEKKAGTAFVLGFGPGLGSFYVREPGYGVLNLLLWPLSICWDPISGVNGAQSINYDATKHYLKKEQEMAALDDKLGREEIDTAQYIAEKRKIMQKYSYD